MPTPDLIDSELSDLQSFEKGSSEPATPRLKNYAAALSLYEAVMSDDNHSAQIRSKVDGMFDGRPPYDQAKLKAAGQGGRANINWGDAQRLLDMAIAGYVDLITSGEFVTDVWSTIEDGVLTIDEVNAVLNEELTAALRSWAEFIPRFLILVTEFLKHGISGAYFDDTSDWRFQVAGLRDLKFPRQTVASSDALDVCFVRKDYTVAQLWQFIDNPDIAESEGWVPESVKRAIMHAHRGDKTSTSHDWEAFQMLVKNSDTYEATQAKSIRLVHMWVKENNGEMSHYIWEERHAERTKDVGNPGKTVFRGHNEYFLYKNEFANKRTSEAFTIFTYGVGNNGTFHSVRGMGPRIFPQVQYLNRFQCQVADAAAIAGGPLLQPHSMEDAREAALQYMGPYNLLKPNIDIVNKGAAPDLTKSMLPVISDMRTQLQDSSDFYSTARAAQGSPYRNTLQVRAELESATRLSAANLSLFYIAWDLLIREVVRRIINGPKSDPAVAEFYRRCGARGLTPAHIRSVDHMRTRAERAVGAGNPAARIAVLDQLNQERAWMDEVGNRNLTFDRVAARIGHDTAKRYVRRDEQPRGSTEQSLASLENAMIQKGMDPPVLPAQFHGTHLEVHLPMAQQIIELVVSQQADPTQMVDVIRGAAQHVLQHAQALSQDPTQEDTVAVAADAANKLRQILENTERAIEADGGGEEPPQEDPKVAAMRQMAEAKKQIMVDMAQLDMDLKRQKAEQDQRLKDMAVASEALRKEQLQGLGDMGGVLAGR